MPKLKFKTAMRQTVAIVEERVATGTSEDAIRDLGFLSEQYAIVGEWDKANSASRQMLRVAEGETNTAFQITPLDVELLMDKRRHKRKTNERLRTIFYTLGLVSIGLISVGVSIQRDPGWPVKLAPFVAPGLAEPYLLRAQYYTDRGDWEKASADCERVQFLEPNNKKVISIKAQIAFEQSDWAAAQELIAQCAPEDARALYAKTWLCCGEGEFSKAGRLFFQSMASGNSHLTAWDLMLSAKAFAMDNDFEAALAANKKAQEIAIDDAQLELVFCDRARYQLAMQNFPAAIISATNCLKIVKEGDLDAKSDAYLSRGQALLNLGNAAAGLNDVNLSIKFGSQTQAHFLLRADCLRALHREHDAEANENLARFF